MFKKTVLTIICLLVLVGCGKTNMKVVSEKTIEAEPGTYEVNEKISKSNNNIKYEFETEKYKVTVTTKYNSKNITYKDGKFKANHYTITMNLEEYDYLLFEDYKQVGYDKLTISNHEALKTISDTREEIIVKISDFDILYITGTTDGKIINTEMTSDKDYREITDNIKIDVTKK